MSVPEKGAKVYDRPATADQNDSSKTKFIIIAIIAILAVLVTVFIVANIMGRQSPQEIGSGPVGLIPVSALLERFHDAAH